MSNEYTDLLATHRAALNIKLAEGAEYVQKNWGTVEPLMDIWWKTYKLWESKDKFNDAFTESRMSVRTFGAGFLKQVSKTFGKGEIQVTSQVKEQDVVREEFRVFADGQYTPFDDVTAKKHATNYGGPVEKQKYFASRGIDSSTFANPDNFKSREAKYAEGLHDLSASLLNPKLSIFDQIHNNEDGAHFSFVALSQEEDQETIFSLVGIAKQLKLMLPALDGMVRGYRAAMTRVKLACEFDMAIGYSITPHKDWEKRVGKEAPRGTGIGRSYKPGIPLPAYKLRYGLGLLTTVTGEGGQSKSVTVTSDILLKRQEAARKFKSILGIRDAKNEIVVAIRQHAGPFPVYGTRVGAIIKCYDIASSQLDPTKKTMKYNQKTISATGVMT
jgi:hypothetical protein